MQKPNVLIFGASGVVGSEMVRLLAGGGKKVRITTTKKPSSKQDVEQVKVNLLTGDGVQKAFEGIERAFFMSPGGVVDQYGVLSPLVREAKRMGLKKVVLMTAMGANAVETSPMRRAEIELETSGLSYNIIRPNWFMQNFHSFWVQGIRDQGKILLPAGKAKVSFIDTGDISAVAAKLLFDDSFNNRAFDLTGPEAVDHNYVAQELSRATGKIISYQEVEPAVLRQGLIGAGLTPEYSDFMLILFGFVREGYAAPVTDHVKAILGRAPSGFRAYAQANKTAWLERIRA